MSVNHPWAWDCAWRMPLAGPADLVEMWHWTWDRRDTDALTDWPSFGQRAIGGSDFHRPGSTAQPGSPTTWLECADRSVEAVLDALRDGRVAISASPDGPVLIRDGDEFVPSTPTAASWSPPASRRGSSPTAWSSPTAPEASECFGSSECHSQR